MKRWIGSCVLGILVILCLSRVFLFNEKSSSSKKPLKTLILIIASLDQPVYHDFYNSWRSYMHSDPEHFECYFIRANPSLTTPYVIEGDTIWIQSEENLIPGLLNKTLIAFDAFSSRLNEFDYILRANLSSFFVFPNLLKYLEKAPRSNLYSGICHRSDKNDTLREGWRWICGAGIIFSTDVVDLLMHHEKELWNHSLIDDVAIGRLLEQLNIPFVSGRCQEITCLKDWAQVRKSFPFRQIKKSFPLRNVYHFRIKVMTRKDEQRYGDAAIHAFLCKAYYDQDIQLVTPPPQYPRLLSLVS